MLGRRSDEEGRCRDLEEQLRALLEEARVVIPGVQTLLGFQLVVVFNQLFPQTLSRDESNIGISRPWR